MRLNIVVLAGGLSGERDVSLSSGAKVTEALRQRGRLFCLSGDELIAGNGQKDIFI